MYKIWAPVDVEQPYIYKASSAQHKPHHLPALSFFLIFYESHLASLIHFTQGIGRCTATLLHGQ